MTPKIVTIDESTICAVRGKLEEYSEPQMQGAGQPWERMETRARFAVGHHPKLRVQRIFTLQGQKFVDMICDPSSIGKYFDITYTYISGVSKTKGEWYCMISVDNVKPTPTTAVEDAQAAVAAEQFTSSNNEVPF